MRALPAAEGGREIEAPEILDGDRPVPLADVCGGKTGGPKLQACEDCGRRSKGGR